MNKLQIRIFFRSRGKSYFKTPSSWSEHHLHISKLYQAIEFLV